jgi:hypothetical protein
VCTHCGGTRSQAKGRRSFARPEGIVTTQSRLCSSCKRQFTVRLGVRPLERTDESNASRNAPRAPKAFSPAPAQSQKDTAQSHRSVSPAAHRRLELVVPSDSSFDGLLSFAAFAQQELQAALAQYDDPLQAELEWQGLDANLRVYIQARQRLEFAFALQWNAAFSQVAGGASMHAREQPSTPPLPNRLAGTSGHTGKSHAAAAPVLATASRAPVQTRTGNRQPSPQASESESSDEPTEPDRSASLEELTFLLEERASLRSERLQLKQRLFALEADNVRLTGHWTTLKGHVARLKSVVASESPNSLEAAAETEQPRTAKRRVRPPSERSRTARTASPPASRWEAENIGRLASAVLAHLPRLEGQRVRPRDLPNVTGERGPWRAVVTHLLSLGKIVWEGEFVTLSLLERIRRNL